MSLLTFSRRKVIVSQACFGLIWERTIAIPKYSKVVLFLFCAWIVFTISNKIFRGVVGFVRYQILLHEKVWTV